VRPTRWSKKAKKAKKAKQTDELVRTVAGRCRPRLQSELGHWMEDNSRFQSFVVAHQDKIRKKLSADDEEARQDVRAELLVAERLLMDRRFEVTFEAYGAKRLGPDLSVAYRRNDRFNLEVTRVRTAEGLDIVKLTQVMAGKLRQMPVETANALIIVGRELGLTADSLPTAARLLRSQMAGEIAAQYPRLGGVLVLDEASQPMAAEFWASREARHALTPQAVTALTACFGR
jgi:hypothetical protein